MKKTLLLLAVLITTNFISHAQSEPKTNIFFDGLYIAKTGSVPAANLEIFTYLLFYNDGTVYLQAVSSNDPQSVSKWFGRDKKYSKKGTFKIDGTNISIRLDNNETDDILLEGFAEIFFKGVINQNNEMCMIRDNEKEEKCFVFAKTQ